MSSIQNMAATSQIIGSQNTESGSMDPLRPPPRAIDQLHECLAALGLSEADAVIETCLERASKEEPSYAQFLTDLLRSELTARQSRQ